LGGCAQVSADDRGICFGQGVAGDARITACDRVLAFAFANRGNGWMTKREYDRALADFNEAIKLVPTYAGAFVGRGTYWFAKKEAGRALADFNEAIKLDPRNANAYAGRGLVSNYKRAHDHAISDFEAAINLDPSNVLAYLGRGEAHLMKKQYHRALTDFNEAVRLEPKNTTALSDRAITYESMGEYEKALADFRVAVAINPQETAAVNGIQRVQRTVATRADPQVARPPAAQVNDAAAKAAVVVGGRIELIFRRLGVCADVDSQNAAIYNFTAVEYLRGVAVTFAKTDNVIETEMRRARADPGKGKAARKQAFDMLEQQMRSQAEKTPNEFIEECRTLTQNFLVRRSPFEPLAKILPTEMRALDEWR
jgi:tetratricopeptide (TPR) repeat protein